MNNNKRHYMRGPRVADIDKYIDGLEARIEELEDALEQSEKEKGQYIRKWVAAQEQSHTRLVKSMLGINLAEDQMRMDEERKRKNGQEVSG